MSDVGHEPGEAEEPDDVDRRETSVVVAGAGFVRTDPTVIRAEDAGRQDVSVDGTARPGTNEMAAAVHPPAVSVGAAAPAQAAAAVAGVGGVPRPSIRTETAPNRPDIEDEASDGLRLKSAGIATAWSSAGLAVASERREQLIVRLRQETNGATEHAAGALYRLIDVLERLRAENAELWRKLGDKEIELLQLRLAHEALEAELRKRDGADPHTVGFLAKWANALRHPFAAAVAGAAIGTAMPLAWQQAWSEAERNVEASCTQVVNVSQTHVNVVDGSPP